MTSLWMTHSIFIDYDICVICMVQCYDVIYSSIGMCSMWYLGNSLSFVLTVCGLWFQVLLFQMERVRLDRNTYTRVFRNV